MTLLIGLRVLAITIFKQSMTTRIILVHGSDQYGGKACEEDGGGGGGFSKFKK